ncbi:DoxX family protein [Mycolicibacterium nivoides]|uniref:DoxX family protein n=1 Tax=Mycolicibacterium nivoides TaxID=2487344 RepID=UPI000F5BD990|nr:DoxX family protein [Mycolicibacterium nivoides]QRY45177.1 DoxX family protein [Mycolicibacterium boenickei]
MLFVLAGTAQVIAPHRDAELAAVRRVRFVTPGLVRLGGVVQALAGIAVILGIRTTVAAGMLAVFLVVATLTMHRFWAAEDPAERASEQAHFLKNVALIGGALVVSVA